MKKEITENKKDQKAIVNLFILDASASMESIKSQIIEGFNTQVKKVKELAKKHDIPSFASLIVFNSAGCWGKEANDENLGFDENITNSYIDSTSYIFNNLKKVPLSKLGNRDACLQICENITTILLETDFPKRYKMQIDILGKKI